MSISTNQVKAILANKQWTARVVIAAATALNTLTNTVGDVTPDGDSAAMSVRSILGNAFIDHDAIRAVAQ